MDKTNLYSSIKVLLTLYVMMKQDFESLVYYSRYLSNGLLKSNLIPSKNEILDSTIIDSLRFSIVLKACSFLDEWDSFLGVRNEEEHQYRISIIKKVTAKARRAINQWKDLRKFRNEIIAHNLRGKDNSVKIDFLIDYDCPQSIEEIGYLVSFIERMINVLTSCYSEIANKIVLDFYSVVKEKTPSKNSTLELEKKLDEVDSEIANLAFDIFRYDLADLIVKQNLE